MSWTHLRALPASIVIVLLWTVLAQADQVEQFYKGRQLTLIVPAGSGGSYGNYARLTERHFAKHIPGHPTLVVQHMPGAGGTKATNYVYNVSPRDGSVIMMLFGGSPQSQALGVRGIKFDITKMPAIGQYVSFWSTISVLDHSPAKTLEEAKKSEVVLGATGKTSPQYQMPILLNELIGTKFKVVTGYKGVNEQDQAMESGELHGRTGSLLSWGVSRPDWIKNRRLIPLIRYGKTGMEMEGFGNIPNLNDMKMGAEERKMVDLLASSSTVGYSLSAPPAIPTDRLTALRRAFDAAVEDPELLADAKRMKVHVYPAAGEQLQAILTDVMDTPAAVVARLKKTLDLK